MTLKYFLSPPFKWPLIGKLFGIQSIFFPIRKCHKWSLGFKPKHTNFCLTQCSHGRSELPFMTMFCCGFYYARKWSMDAKLDCQEPWHCTAGPCSFAPALAVHPVLSISGDIGWRWGAEVGMQAKENCAVQTDALPSFSPQPSLPGAVEVGLECLVVWSLWKAEEDFLLLWARWRWPFIFGKCSIHRGLPVFGNSLTQHLVLNL